MFDPKVLKDLAQQFTENLPPSVKEANSEIEKNVHQFLQGAFTKLDLVSREEFDVQADVLARTRAKLENLERQLAQLEKQLQEKSKPTD